MGKISLTGYRGTWVSTGQQRGNIGHGTMIIMPVLLSLKDHCERFIDPAFPVRMKGQASGLSCYG
jgi:hypothetical protein